MQFLSLHRWHFRRASLCLFSKSASTSSPPFNFVNLSLLAQLASVGIARLYRIRSVTRRTHWFSAPLRLNALQ